MRIAIIGTGKMGRGFAHALAPTHQVVVGSRDPDRAAATEMKAGATGGAAYAEAVANADVVILTVPSNAMDDALGQLGDLAGTAPDSAKPMPRCARSLRERAEPRTGGIRASRRAVQHPSGRARKARCVRAL